MKLQNKSVLVNRKGALGDVLLTTPIVKRLSEEGAIVDVLTSCGDVFKDSPYVRKVERAFRHGKHDVGFNLDLAYENSPNMHIIDAYSKVVFKDTNTPHKPELHINSYTRFSLDDKLISIPKKPFFVIHMSVGWENRTWSRENWHTVADTLATDDLICIIVGSRSDYNYTAKNIYSLVDHLNIHELMLLISEAEFFIGFDSAPLHIAQTTETLCVGLYTCAKAEYRMTSSVCYPIVPELDCYGCLHTYKAPVVYCGCKRKDFACLKEITPEKVIKKVKEICPKYE